MDKEMFELFIRGIRKKAPLTDEAIATITGALKVRFVKKKKDLLREGENGNLMFYVNKGLFRYYIFDARGHEHTIDIIAENNWFGDAKAFLANEPAGINIEALEDSQVFAISYEDLNRFYDEIPMFERLVRKIVEQYFIKALERITKVSRSSYSAQERYQEFLRSHPKLFNRVPAVYLASYLGITPETLSRLRTHGLKKLEY